MYYLSILHQLVVQPSNIESAAGNMLLSRAYYVFHIQLHSSRNVTSQSSSTLKEFPKPHHSLKKRLLHSKPLSPLRNITPNCKPMINAPKQT